MERKSDKVRRLVREGQYKAALGIVKGFRLGITPEQSSVFVLAYESMVHEQFYRQLGQDTKQNVSNGIALLTQMYGGQSDGKKDLHQQIQQS